MKQTLVRFFFAFGLFLFLISCRAGKNAPAATTAPTATTAVADTIPTTAPPAVTETVAATTAPPTETPEPPAEVEAETEATAVPPTLTPLPPLPAGESYAILTFDFRTLETRFFGKNRVSNQSYFAKGA